MKVYQKCEFVAIIRVKIQSVLTCISEECVDMRKESCYLNYESGECFNPMMHPQTKMLCCCSMGAAWGSPCEKCPAERTRKHENIFFSNERDPTIS